MAKGSYFGLEVQKVIVLQTELLRSDSRLDSLIILLGTVHTVVEVCKIDLEICRLVK